MTDTHGDLLSEQVAYYRARAAEYDATSTPDDDPFAAHAQALRAAVRRLGPRGRVVEIAAGTGQWTSILAEYADDLTATDASPEMLDLNRAKVAAPEVTYQVADAFALAPTHDFAVVFFGFFLSHVPPSAFGAFWQVVEGLLAPGGRVFFVDEADHGLWDEDWIDRSRGIIRRTLTDGAIHRAVKVLWQVDELEHALRGLGWKAAITRQGPFYWGQASR